MLNVVALMGRLVADPQLRQTTTGKNVASFRVAVDRGRKDANGQNQADFFDIVAWDKSAEFICRYFQKGSMIAVEGRLQSRNYQDKNGSNRTAIEVVTSNVSFAGNKEPKVRTWLIGPFLRLWRQTMITSRLKMTVISLLIFERKAGDEIEFCTWDAVDGRYGTSTGVLKNGKRRVHQAVPPHDEMGVVHRHSNKMCVPASAISGLL